MYDKDEITALRRRLHAFPELSGRETKTAAFIDKYIRNKTGFKTYNIDGSLIAVYSPDSERREPIAFRAELDAVPVEEADELSYASKNPGAAHKCGHDGHMAALLAFMLSVAEDKPERKIYFIFQKAEEIGEGASLFDIPGFGADFAYTVDGGDVGGIEYENFNAASAIYTIHGVSVHPGSAKGRMVNANRLACELNALFPGEEVPERTEGYEGFYHLCDLRGSVEECLLHYIIRDHDRARFEARKELMRRAAEFIDARYGAGTLALDLKDSYYNMKEKIAPHMHLIDTARAAMQEMGIEPIIVPIRGGTDGARLSYMGLPCPNLCTGGHNGHGVLECITAQALETVSQLLVKIVEKTYAR